eukprot:CAMPEP_0197525208 /NCGR_PEP_ID=MMETSP1318-20131121/10685_1 /TAXON_ID=552666 /ORGANISM="Partenskyella glossopodia, Strain RCC365" /LENGTH=379 /DNA_ID=CAMNT_0043078397 /DNA_START=59 /DNA_END=1198 /DNA_ORIENTATION=-
MPKDEIKIEDSNMAFYGSAEHKSLRFDAASLETEYKGAGDKGPGIQIWRVKNMKRTDETAAKFGIVKVRTEEYGTFYRGDSYIVLETYLIEQKKAFNLYFWLGSESTQDEIGVAAYKTVELDDLLGDVPVQYREVDGMESFKFLKLFKRFQVLAGGFDSGFIHVKPEEYKPRLLHLKGAKNTTLQVKEVQCAKESLNEGDSFVLDLGLKVYVFHGQSAGMWEKNRAAQIAHTIKGMPGRGKATSHLVSSSDEDEKSFWTALGGFGKVQAAIPDEKKQETKTSPKKCELWRFSDSSGTLKLSKVSSAPKKKDVSSDDVFLLDKGDQLLVYVGSKVSKKERYAAVGVGLHYLRANDLPTRVPISKFIEGVNDGDFFSAFAA